MRGLIVCIIRVATVVLVFSSFAYGQDAELQKLANDRQVLMNRMFQVIGKIDLNNSMLVEVGRRSSALDEELKGYQVQLDDLNAKIRAKQNESAKTP